MHFAHIADREIAVQRLADRNGVGALVVAGQADMQLLIQTNAQLQVDLVWPAWQAVFGAGQEEFDLQAFTLGLDAAQLPVHRPHQPMGSGGFVADAHRLDALRVARQVAEPRPAHWHTGADAFAGLEHGLVVEPDQRRLPSQLIAEDVRTLLGHQQFGLTVADAPAVQFIQFDGFNVGRAHGTALDQ
ncbi:hypothetical protein D3C76_1072320 [compost metagenome]